ncbi:MAG: alpha/beta hydrolase [Acidobacteria bacterium]|nr:alpha/beta hydrolase [Acidobacteriota bacterium]
MSRPDIILLHGILGGHLRLLHHLPLPRVWIDPVTLVLDNIAQRLTLASDGIHEAFNAFNLEPDGQVELVYEAAVLDWSVRGFAVHQFSFDWRKGIEHLADSFQVFLLRLRDEDPARKYVVVAHSMGGLVAAMYAKRHAEALDLIERAIFAGVPLAGSFAPMDALIGSFPLLNNLAEISTQSTPQELRFMASTLPGLIDMLPNPAVFAESRALYQRLVWPGDSAPEQFWLDQSLRLKAEILFSPLLERTTILAGIDHPTLSGASFDANGKAGRGSTGLGDGTVPGGSALASGRPAFRLEFPHPFLPLDPGFLRAVPALIDTGECDLPVIRPEDLAGPAPELVAPGPRLFEEIRSRFHGGLAHEADVKWLLSGLIHA